MMTTDFRAKRADQLREQMRHIRMPFEVLEMAAGPEELSEYATTVASLAAGLLRQDAPCIRAGHIRLAAPR